jgi:hypothetical protein
MNKAHLITKKATSIIADSFFYLNAKQLEKTEGRADSVSSGGSKKQIAQ